MIISPSKNRLEPIFCAYWIISRDASLEPIFKGHSLLFIAASHLLLKYTVLNIVSGSTSMCTTSTRVLNLVLLARVVCVYTHTAVHVTV